MVMFFFKPLRLLTTLLLLNGPLVVDAAPKKKHKPNRAPMPAVTPTQFSGTALTMVSLSLTITPAATDSGIEVPDAERMQTVATWLHVLDADFAMRFQDGQVTGFACSRERGEGLQRPHAQGMYDVMVTAQTEADLKLMLERERAYLKALLDPVTARRFRLNLKFIKPNERAYVLGYLKKDSGQAHYIFVSHGFSDQELQDALDSYRAKAGQNAFASSKMNKAPTAEERQLAFAVGNLFVLAAWFAHQHGLLSIRKSLTLAILVAFALSTGRYRVDESLVVGKHGGQPFDGGRADAFFQLSLVDTKDTITTHALLQRALFTDAPSESPECIAECRAARLPTPSELIAHYSLEDAKALAQDRTTASAVDGPQRRGRFLVLDFLSCSQSQEAIDTMTASGLLGAAHRTTSQLPDVCGYLAAGWACEMHALSDAFHQYDMVSAATLNDAAFIAFNNHAVLERPDLGGNAMWLSGDDILALAAHSNPDGAGTSPGWLSGPAPMNFWHVHFQRTVASPREHGRVHMMVVNNVNAYSLVHTGPAPGQHWFLVAWYIEPEQPL